MKKIAVLTSGGIDSSVALRILKEQGYDCTAFYLKIWLEDELSFLGDCPWQEDLDFVQKTCDQLNIPLKIISMQKTYHEQVVSYTLDSIKKGLTPNPDMLCNTFIKCGAFWEKIKNDFDFMATGHYVERIEKENNMFFLKMNKDEVKDQSYFLAYVSKESLSNVLFPIGAMKKSEIREYAKMHNLPTAFRKDSQGVCFLGKIKFKDFIEYHLGKKQGPLIEYETEKTLGFHDGYWFYTIGQRQGIGLSGGPYYVVAKDINANIVYVSKDYYTIDKKRDFLYLDQLNVLEYIPDSNELIYIKLRHGKDLHCGYVIKEEKGYRINLSKQDQGIAAGQFAVIYNQDKICLFSGIIQGF